MKKVQQTQLNIATSIIPGHCWKFFVLFITSLRPSTPS